MGAQPPNHLERNIRPDRMPHQNHAYVLDPFTLDILHQLRQLVLGMSNLVLQPVRGRFAPLDRLHVGTLDFKPAQRPPEDLELDGAVRSRVVAQKPV